MGASATSGDGHPGSAFLLRPVVTPAEMAAIDAAAPEPVAVLIERAGWETAKAAIGLIGPSLYGKRIAVVVGKGNNGADGRAAVRHLHRRGAQCVVLPIGETGPGPPRRLDVDLIIDACYGTGLTREFDHRTMPIEIDDQTPVLAVDIPSGVDGLTGQRLGNPLPATATVTFAALKPGLLLEPGRTLAGPVTVADIGLDCRRATSAHLGPPDISVHWPRRATDSHKWRNAVLVVGGSPGMTGAPALSATAALRAGAGYVGLAVPGTGSGGPAPSAGGGPALETGAQPVGPIEAVALPAAEDWVDQALDGLDRFGSVVVGPGLEVEPRHLRRFLGRSETPTVLDAGAMAAVAEVTEHASLGLPAPSAGGPLHVLTPHDGEFRRLTGTGPGEDRVAAVRAAASGLGAVVLLKGSTTIVAHPDGRVLLSTAGDHRLATAGSGDVLAGVIAAGIAGGLEPFLAAGVGAELHGIAGSRGYRVGLVSGDLPSLIAQALSELMSE